MQCESSHARLSICSRWQFKNIHGKTVRFHICSHAISLHCQNNLLEVCYPCTVHTAKDLQPSSGWWKLGKDIYASACVVYYRLNPNVINVSFWAMSTLSLPWAIYGIPFGGRAINQPSTQFFFYGAVQSENELSWSDLIMQVGYSLCFKHHCSVWLLSRSSLNINSSVGYLISPFKWTEWWNGI